MFRDNGGGGGGGLGGGISIVNDNRELYCGGNMGTVRRKDQEDGFYNGRIIPRR